MALLLHLRSRTKTNPYLIHHLFSTSNTGGDGDGGGDQGSPNSNSPFSSYFKGLKETLKQSSPSVPRLSNTRSTNFSFPASSDSQKPSLHDIQKHLSEFRRRTVVPPPGGPPSSSQQDQISFQEIYKRSLLQKPGESTGNDADLGPAKFGGGAGPGSMELLRESVRQISSGDRKGGDRMSLTGLKDALRWKPSDSKVFGGTSALPESIFGREMREKREGDGLSAEMKTEFVKMYGYEELGEKLKNLRPAGKGKEWFSLGELNERLMRLREMEEKEYESKNDMGSILRQCLVKGLTKPDGKSNKTSRQ